ncbi:MAG: glycosyltransferase family 2 protein [Bacteroidetes bacterium]|nr:MAG: glycosyltransferase family 2 protein [Bacteroidota bacterium]
MEKLSVVIITFNEEHAIGRCIDSVKSIADEIIVLDSYSTDRTVEIAIEKGARVTRQKFAGYIEQKNDALALASFPFVLSLDADEAVDEQLGQSISQIKSSFPSPAYTMNRCTNYCGQFIRHGSWYPDKKLRLFDKRIARWGGINPHDKVIMDKAAQAIHLKGDILHFSYRSVDEHVQQNNRFSTISAAAIYGLGKRTNLFKIVINPFWAFLQSYFVRAGFLDGFYGFVIAINIAHLTFLKHVKLYLLQKPPEIVS